MPWEQELTGDCFHSFFEVTQTSMSVFIRKLDYELKISIPS